MKRRIVTAALCASLIVVCGRFRPIDAAHSEPAPAVTLLSPQAGAALNAATLEVRALVAAVKPAPRRTFVFNGQAIEGRNAGQLTHVDLAVDGALRQRLDVRGLGRQILAEFQVDLTPLDDGSHTLVISAFQGDGRTETKQTALRTFTLDRSLVPAILNRIELAATPIPFVMFGVRDWDGIDDEDEDLDGDRTAPTRFDLKGVFAPGPLSDGIDLAHDKVVVSLGADTALIPPEAWRCDRRLVVCTVDRPSDNFLRFASLKHRADGRWSIRLRGRSLPPNRSLFVRIGNDWGGADLATGELLESQRPALDVAFQQAAIIGSAGGSVETIDSAQVKIRLDVPAGALTRDTLITMTPLRTSALGGASPSVRPGIDFEPAGLQFASPATLTFDFGASVQQITAVTQIALVTSPATALPLFGTVDVAQQTLTAYVHHFSLDAPTDPATIVTDVVWAETVLSSSSPLTLAEIQSLLAIAHAQQHIGCTNDCLDLALLSGRVQNSVAALAAALCSAAVSSPSDADLIRLTQLEQLLHGLGGNPPSLLPCIRQELQSLITGAGASALFRLSDVDFQRLVQYRGTAQAFGFSDLETLALQQLAAGLRALLAEAQNQSCGGNAGTATNILNRGLSWVSPVAPVDATLAADLQTALDNIQSGHTSCRAMNVVINPADTINNAFFGTFIAISGEALGCAVRLVTPAGIQDLAFPPPPHTSCDIPPILRVGGAPSAPPFALEGAAAGSQMRYAVTQPAANVLAVDATASAISAFDRDVNVVSAGIVVDLTFTKAGALGVSINTDWVQQPYDISDRGLVAVQSPLSPNLGFVAYASFPGTSQPQQPAGTLSIAGPGTMQLFVVFGVSHSALGDGVGGAGRVVTLTFTASQP